MNTRPDDLPGSLSRLFSNRWHRHYSAAKLRSDPLYDAVHAEIGHSDLPLLDLGCGIGLLAFYLRARGGTAPATGLDYDSKKIAEANRTAASVDPKLRFHHHDARQGLPTHSGNLTILDILQFFTPDEQQALLTAAAERVAPGGKLVIRSGLRDSSWRFHVTVAGDILAKVTFWMKAAPTHYPTRETFERALDPFGKLTIRPLWGGTPFNNHLIVLEVPSVPPAARRRP